MSETGGVIVIVLGAIVWATTGTSAALATDASSAQVGVSALCLGGLLLLGVFLRPASRALRTKGARRWLLLGGVSVFAYAFAFYASMDLAGVAVGTVLNLGSAPVFSALIEMYAERRRPSWRWSIGSAVGVVGLVLVTAQTEAAEPPGAVSLAVGIVLALAAGALYALYTYASRRAVVHVGDARGTMAAVFGIGGLLLAPFAVIQAPVILGSPRSTVIVLYLAIVAVFLAYWLFGIALRVVPASLATTITLLEPALASVLAVVALGERISMLGWSGVAAVTAGVAIAVFGPGRRPPKPEVVVTAPIAHV